jgi:2-oxo-4-hydroxy-4-carboxy-5-ureidoimidazoline decarboxylase
MEHWHEIDNAPADAARRILQRACGSTRWIERMLTRRPFGSDAALKAAAREEWFALGEHDWLEAFSHHPKIGDRAPLAARFPSTHDLSAKEQSGAAGASADVIAEFSEANHAYVNRFGFIFIVCATGKTAEEMLRTLRDRLGNDRATEVRIAADEQAKITALRLS